MDRDFVLTEFDRQIRRAGGEVKIEDDWVGVVATDLDTKRNRKTARRFARDVDVRFADLTDARPLAGSSRMCGRTRSCILRP